MTRRDEAGWAHPKVISILVAVFLCGSVLGATLMREYLHHRFPIPSAHDFIYHGKRVKFDNMKADLNLSATQEQTVKQVLDDYAKYYQNLEEQREDVTEAGKHRIDAVLDPEQRRRFSRLLDEPTLQN